MNDANQSKLSKTSERACRPRKLDPAKQRLPELTPANYARLPKEAESSATALLSAYTVIVQKWRNTKLATTTTRNQMKRSFSVILMAIPRDHLASSAGSQGPARMEPMTAERSYPQSLRLLDRRRRLLRLRRFVADQAHFAKEFRHLHAGERFEERRHLRGNLGDISGQLVRAGGIAVASGNDGHLVHLAERLAERAHHFRESGDEFVEHGGLVVLLEGFRLDVHGLGFGFAFLEDDFGFGFTLRADRRSAAFRFGYQPLTLGAGQRFDALAFDFRRLQHGSDELALAALDFCFLHLYLGFTLHLLHSHGFGDDLLLHDVGLDLVSFVGGRLGFFRHFEVAGSLEVQVALRLGLFG